MIIGTPPTVGATTTPGSVDNQAAAIAQAASDHNVPIPVLLGVYGAESTYGTAYGAGQKTFGYFGLTSSGLWNPAMTFAQDAETAAATLEANYKSHGNSWDSALQAYSGSSYGLAHATQMANSAPKSLRVAILHAAGNVFLGGGKAPGVTVSPGPDTPAGVANSLTGVFSGVFSWLTTPANWLRILEFAAGAVAVFYALMQLSGAGNKVTQVVTATASKVR